MKRSFNSEEKRIFANKKRRLSESRFADFEFMEKLGEGTYGIVQRAKHKPTGQIVAIKKVKTDTSEDEGIPATTIREVSLLRALSHPNIIALYACITDIANINQLYLVFEYMEMDLKKYMETEVPSQMQIHKMTVSLLSGINYCLSMGIYHRDLKPQNILVNKNGKIKIADFGLGREVLLRAGEPITREVVTLWYRCPEILMGVKLYGFGVDSWALGCIIAEFFYKKPLFQGECEIDQLFKIFRQFGTPTQDTWKDFEELKHYSNQFPKWKGEHISTLLKDNACAEVIDLIGQLLKLDPRKRITPKMALKHSYCKMTLPQLRVLDSLKGVEIAG